MDQPAGIEEEGRGPWGAAPAFQWVWTAVVIALSALPHLANAWLTPAGMACTWAVSPYPEDQFAYMAWSRQAWHGALLFSMKYTAVPHDPFVFHPVFLACGRLARLLGAGVGPAQLLVKSAGVALFAWSFFALLEHLRLDRARSAAAAALVAVSSGFGGFLEGWVGPAALDPLRSADLWVVDANTLWSLQWSVVFPYSLALVLLGVRLMDAAARDHDRRRAWFAGAAVGGLAVIHPYPALLLLPLLALVAGLRLGRGAAGLLARAAAAASPGILYVLAAGLLHPLVREHGETGLMLSPGPLALCLGLGLPGILAFALAALDWETAARRHWVLLAWAATAFLGAYAPVWFQRKLLFGIHVPVCILAALALVSAVEKLGGRAAGRAGRRRELALAAALGVLVPISAWTHARNLVEGMDKAAENQDGVYMVRPELREALDFLRDRTDPSALVFASVRTSLLIPALAGNPVLWGHWAQSVDYRRRMDWYKRLAAGAPGWDAKARVREFWRLGVEYVVVDPVLEPPRRDLFWRGVLADCDEAFRNRGAVIYRRKGASVHVGKVRLPGGSGRRP